MFCSTEFSFHFQNSPLQLSIMNVCRGKLRRTYSKSRMSLNNPCSDKSRDTRSNNLFKTCQKLRSGLNKSTYGAFMKINYEDVLLGRKLLCFVPIQKSVIIHLKKLTGIFHRSWNIPTGADVVIFHWVSEIYATLFRLYAGTALFESKRKITVFELWLMGPCTGITEKYWSACERFIGFSQLWKRLFLHLFGMKTV